MPVYMFSGNGMSKADLIRQQKLDTYRIQLGRRTFFNGSQIDYILDYLHEQYREVRPRVPAGFKRDTLYALQLINAYASEKKIRFDDALLVLHEYATSPLDTNELMAP